MLLRMVGFKGMAPKEHPANLPDNMAELAVNCDFRYGHLAPLKTAVAVAGAFTGRAGKIRSIHRMGPGDNDALYWMTWPGYVSAVRAQVFDDDAERTYFAGTDANGNNWSTVSGVTTLALATGATPYPNTQKAFGVPRPAAAPTLADGGLAATLTTPMSGTTADISTGATPHGMTTDSYAVISGAPAPVEFLNGVHKVASVPALNRFTVTLSASQTVAAPPGGFFVAERASAATERRYYAYTYVSSLGEESEPSDPSLPVDVVDGQVITAAVTPLAGYTVRLYRTATGSTATDFQLVNPEGDITGASYTDNKAKTELGEVIPSVSWHAPPEGLAGLVNLPNGLTAGFKGRSVYISPAYRPYTYPEDYAQTVEHDVVALGAFGASLVAATRGKPVLFGGIDPSAMSMQHVDVPYACASARSMVSSGEAAIYASDNGLVYIGTGGVRLLTEALFTRAEWTARSPENISCAALFDGRYLAFTEDGSGSFSFDLATGDFSTLDQAAYAAYVEPRTNEVFLSVPSGVDSALYKWAAGGNGQYRFKSKKWELPTPTGFSLLQVIADDYSDITVNVYADGALLIALAPTSREALRLPAIRAVSWQVELVGSSPLRQVLLAQAAQELSGV